MIVSRFKASPAHHHWHPLLRRRPTQSLLRRMDSSWQVRRQEPTTNTPWKCARIFRGAADEIISFLQKHMTREAAIGSVKRTDLYISGSCRPCSHYEYYRPCRYAQRGAPICVALFDDRLEIENPGLLPFGLTIEGNSQRTSQSLQKTPRQFASAVIRGYLGLAYRLNGCGVGFNLRPLGYESKGRQPSEFLYTFHL